MLRRFHERGPSLQHHLAAWEPGLLHTTMQRRDRVREGGRGGKGIQESLHMGVQDHGFVTEYTSIACVSVPVCDTANL